MKRRKIIGIFILLGIICYIAMLLIIVVSEHFSNTSNINSLWDAVWYSLVTLTSVGYGDLYPTSIAGRIVGIIFLFGSIFVLSAVVTAFMSIFAGQWIPMMVLRGQETREWFVFTDDNIQARTLAYDLLKQNPTRMIIYLHPEQTKASSRWVELDPEETDFRYRKSKSVAVWNLPIDAEMLAEKHYRARRTLVCINPSPLKNIEAAKEALPLGYRIVCCTNLGMDQLPNHVTTFQPLQSMAQIYWNHHPLSQKEQTVLFIGCGHNGEALLEKALLTNVFSPTQQISYHVFGDSDHFKMCHSHLVDALQTDQLLFHEEDWRADIQLIRNADRIIICTDDDEENMLIQLEMLRYFSTAAKIHMLIHNDNKITTPVRDHNIIYFGSATEVFTEEYVINQKLSQMAWAMNEFYRKRHLSTAKDWDHLPDMVQQYYYATGSHLLVKVRLLLHDESIKDLTFDNCEEAYLRYRKQVSADPDYFRSIEHMRWQRFYFMYNWEIGPERDQDMRQHPQLKNYDELTPEETVRYEQAWNIIGLIRDILKHKI